MLLVCGSTPVSLFGGLLKRYKADFAVKRWGLKVYLRVSGFRVWGFRGLVGAAWG